MIMVCYKKNISTCLPNSHFISCATRWATVMAATRRGCVHAIMPLIWDWTSWMYWGICVVFPDPVSPLNLYIKISNIV